MAIQYHKDENRPYVFIQIWEAGRMKCSKPISVKKDDETWVNKLEREITPKTKILALSGNHPTFTVNVEKVIELIQQLHTAKKEV